MVPTDDYRKRSRDLILVPYLVLRRGITDENQISDIIMEWADKCSELKRLEPSRREFESRVRMRVRQVMQEKVPHMKLETLEERMPDVYERIKPNGGA